MASQPLPTAPTSSGQLDESLWGRMLCRRGNLDILGSAPFEFAAIQKNPERPCTRTMLMGNNGTICVDLPRKMREDASSKREPGAGNFSGSRTLDLGTLHMAKRKADSF